MSLLFEVSVAVLFLCFACVAFLGLCQSFFDGVYVSFDAWEIVAGLTKFAVCATAAYVLIDMTGGAA